MKPVATVTGRMSLVALVVAATTLASAQTQITAPPNKYTVAQDVELGQKAAAEAEQQLPIMRDDQVSSYVDNLGRRLVEEVPPEFRHREFRYSFKVVNLREINAFALPGGPTYIHRGMIEAAKNEGEVAGVMAHELSHVVLRHGTAQASKATKYEIGSVAGAVLGAIIGGGWGRVIAEGTQFGLGTAFMRFGREFEKHADILGAQIMARAGYDPRDMASMFKTIEKQGGSGGPQWMSDHPNPGNRVEYITKEAQTLRVENPIRDTRGFTQIKTYFSRLPPAPSAEQNARSGGGGRTPTGTSGRTSAPPSGRVDPPSSRYKTFQEGDLFEVSVPSNWEELPGNNAVTFAPEGGYGSYNGQSVFTHGVEIGALRNGAEDLRASTDELIASLAQSNPNMGRPSQYQRMTIDGRAALRTTLSNTSDMNGARETIDIVTTQLRDGTLLYTVGVAPRDEYNNYRGVFDRIAKSLRVND